MSLAQSNVRRTQRQIQDLNRKLADESRKEADRTKKIGRANQALRSASSESAVRSRLSEIERHERELGRIQDRKADLTKRIADETKRLHSHQQQVTRERDDEHKRFTASLEREILAAKRDREVLLGQVTASTRRDSSPEVDAYDAFISHASEDKADLVAPLAGSLVEAGFRIWYDDFELTVGDSLRRSIDRGLSESRFGIVILSPNFFAKNWPQYELDGLVTREMNRGSKVILPLWHRVSKDDVRQYSLPLADKVALSTASYGLKELVEQLAKVLRPGEGIAH